MGVSHVYTQVYYREACIYHWTCKHARVPRGQYTTVGVSLYMHMYRCHWGSFSVHMCVHTLAHVHTLPGYGGVYPRHSPLPSPEVASGAAAQEATRGVGTAVATGSPLHCTLIHILAASQGLVKVKARGTDAMEATQRVVAGGAATGRGRQDTFILV